jgi:hypothetical protein
MVKPPPPKSKAPRPENPELLPRKNLPEVYYDDTAMIYWLRTAGDQFIRVNETSVKRRLKRLGFSNEGTKGLNSEVDDLIDDVQEHKAVRFAGPVGGYDVGLYQMNGRAVLVTEPPIIMEPTRDYSDSMMYDYIETLLGPEAIYLHAWLKMAREALLAKNLRSGQAFIMTGAPDHGKSLLAKQIKWMLGGRSADPTQYLKGDTSFNAHLFGSELLLMDDKGGQDDYQTRKHMADEIKQLIAGAFPQCHPKGRTPFTLEPFWRLLMTVNDDQESLQVLPPVSDTTSDKLIIVRTVARAVKFDTSRTDEYEAYSARLRASIPHYLGWLEEWELPDELRHSRFGVVKYHNASVIEMLANFTPEQRMKQMIEEELQGDEDRWLTAREIENLLTAQGVSSVEREARNLFKGPGSCGKYLTRCCRIYPKLLTQATREPGGGSQRYIIHAKSEEKAD